MEKSRSLGTATVLVIDDDLSIVEFLELALAEAGYRVFSAVDGAALRLAQAVHPDVILLDITMPGMDGVEVSRRLRAEADTADIPIVVMSALSRLQGLGASLPVNDRLPKPFDLQCLYDTVARWSQSA